MADANKSAMDITPAPPPYVSAAGTGATAAELLEDDHTTTPSRGYGLKYRVDPTVPFAEFRYWAKVERQEEREAELRYLERRGPMTFTKMIKNRFSKGIHHENKKLDEQEQSNNNALTGPDNEKPPVDSSDDTSGRASLDAEWKTAARAMRTAGWGSIFFLVTTDILGWSGAP